MRLAKEKERLAEEEEVQEFKILRDGLIGMLTNQGLSKRNNETTLHSLRRIQIKKRSEVGSEPSTGLTAKFNDYSIRQSSIQMPKYPSNVDLR